MSEQQASVSTFRDFFENFLWARDWVELMSLEALGFKLKPDGSVDGARALEDVRLKPGKYAKTALPSGNRMVLLGTRLGPVALHEYFTDEGKTKRNLAIMQCRLMASFRLIREARTSEDQLRELLVTFGFPEKDIKNLHEYIEDLFDAMVRNKMYLDREFVEESSSNGKLQVLA